MYLEVTTESFGHYRPFSWEQVGLFTLFTFSSCQASDWEKLQKTLADALEHYNELHAVMDLVLFEEAIQHV